jgi:hypothetical protein
MLLSDQNKIFNYCYQTLSDSIFAFFQVINLPLYKNTLFQLLILPLIQLTKPKSLQVCSGCSNR